MMAGWAIIYRELFNHEKYSGCAMDNMDLKILRVLQEDSSLSVCLLYTSDAADE